MPVHTLQLVVDIPVNGKPISGHVGDGSAPLEQFHGWLGLLQVLDALLTATHEQPAALDSGEAS